jgi:hypothetical protein
LLFVFAAHSPRTLLDVIGACGLRPIAGLAQDGIDGSGVHHFVALVFEGVLGAGVIMDRQVRARDYELRAVLASDRACAIDRTQRRRIIGQPYRQVLSAALFETGYLTETDTSVPRPYDEVLHDTISVLTEATHLTNQPIRQTSSGQWEADPDPRTALPIDWAEFVTLALAGAAANIGGTEQILADRPGSWEAERVRQTLQSTVGVDDEDLLRHRTEPVVIDLWVESILRDINDTCYDEYRDAELELSQREETIPEPDDLPPGPFTPDDPRIAAVDWISVDEQGYLVVKGKAGWGDDPADIALLAELHEEARASLLLQAKSLTTKPTKPLRTFGTRSRNKNAANTPTTPRISPRPCKVGLPHWICPPPSRSTSVSPPRTPAAMTGTTTMRRPRIRATRSSKRSTRRSPTRLPRPRSRALP